LLHDNLLHFFINGCHVFPRSEFRWDCRGKGKS
jgi:hypothetical protein